MNKEISVIEAKNEAQKLAFGPIYFQAVVALKELGILSLLSRNKKGITIPEISKQTNVSEYGVNVLLEAAEATQIVEYGEEGKIILTKIGYVLNSDVMTNVNMNFVNDVCYNGAKYLTQCIQTGKPEGLKTLGTWKSVYEGLSTFPEDAKKSWFDFDHYYSDDAFTSALEIVFKDNPKYIFDIGGNTGKWAFACCAYNSTVKIKILDLNGQLNVSRKNAEERGLANRIDFHQIDLLDVSQKIPKGADVIWMSQFLDCFSRDEIVAILKNVYAASDEHTRIYILEPFIDNQKYDAAKYSLVATSLYFTTIANGNSKMYSIAEMESLVEEAGLSVIEKHPLIGSSYHTILKCKKG
jgi:hypothetical protein